jgi:putative ABC transport system permease protein
MLPTTQGLVSVDGLGGLVRLLLVVVTSAGLAAAINRWGHLGHGRDDLLAALRACLQLVAVGLLIAAVLGSWWLTLGFIILMLAVASLTAGRRLRPKRPGWARGRLRSARGTLGPAPGKLGPARGRPQGSGGQPGRGGAEPGWWFAGVPVVLAAVPVAAGLMLSGLIPRVTIAVVPIVGILIGGAMTATTLAGKHALGALQSRNGEYEAALSLGLLPRDSALLIAREDAALALLPGLDQTRTVGLVTLPGAFVGMLLGGASPLQAAAVQLVVLVALLLVQSIAVLLTLELVARGFFSTRR